MLQLTLQKTIEKSHMSPAEPQLGPGLPLPLAGLADQSSNLPPFSAHGLAAILQQSHTGQWQCHWSLSVTLCGRYCEYNWSDMTNNMQWIYHSALQNVWKKIVVAEFLQCRFQRRGVDQEEEVDLQGLHPRMTWLQMSTTTTRESMKPRPRGKKIPLSPGPGEWAILWLIGLVCHK